MEAGADQTTRSAVSRIKQPGDAGEAVLGCGPTGWACARTAGEWHDVAIGAEGGEHLRDGGLRDVPERFELGLCVHCVPVTARPLLEALKSGFVTLECRKDTAHVAAENRLELLHQVRGH